MPLRDHFDVHGQAYKAASWEAVHAMWPGTMVQDLFRILPEGFQAEPRARLGQYYEIDIGAFETDQRADRDYDSQSNGEGGGVATALQAPPRPTWSVDAEFADEYEYEVLIYDTNRARQLVAAIELVSPGNKDREEARFAFINKCLTLLKQGVCVSMVDLVTNRQFNLYEELLEQVGKKDPHLAKEPTHTYAVTCRTQRRGKHDRFYLDNWFYPMELGKRLPTIPLWLSDEMVVQFDLEPSYEETCRVLHVK
ncbi:MAG: DUF4058 family protein [Gemmatales bacterium]